MAGDSALDGDQRIVIRPVKDGGLATFGPRGELGGDGRRVRGVRDDQEVVGAKPVDDQVVDDAAVLVGDHRVPGPAGADSGDLADERVVERLGRLLA